MTHNFEKAISAAKSGGESFGMGVFVNGSAIHQSYIPNISPGPCVSIGIYMLTSV